MQFNTARREEGKVRGDFEVNSLYIRCHSAYVQHRIAHRMSEIQNIKTTGPLSHECKAPLGNRGSSGVRTESMKVGSSPSTTSRLALHRHHPLPVVEDKRKRFSVTPSCCPLSLLAFPGLPTVDMARVGQRRMS